MKALLVAIALALALAGCTTRSEVTGVSIIEVPPTVQRWVPASYDFYSGHVDGAVLDGAPVLWLWSNGKANLVAVRYVVACPSPQPPFGGYNPSFREVLVAYLGTWTPLAPYPSSATSIEGPMVWSNGDSLGVRVGYFRASFVDSDSTIRGFAQLTSGTPCNPTTPDTLPRTYFTLVREDRGAP